jgi:putative membrane protein
MYLYVKIIHIVAFISWMAGLFYLPRLFVYHVEKNDITGLSDVFTIMERRLYKIIMLPAMMLTYISGVVLMVSGDFLQQPWMHLKLTVVILLTGYHFYLNICHKKLIKDIEAYSGRYLRILNEVPTILLIVIVSVVILKPF